MFGHFWEFAPKGLKVNMKTIRCLFRTQSNICHGAFYEISQRLLAFNFFTKGSIIDVVKRLNPLTINAPHLAENSQLISNANLLTGFYIMGSIGR